MMHGVCICVDFFFFNDTATTEIYTLSLHDALPIWFRIFHLRQEAEGMAAHGGRRRNDGGVVFLRIGIGHVGGEHRNCGRSGEHTSEIQSPWYILCRLLLVKKNRPHTASAT